MSGKFLAALKGDKGAHEHFFASSDFHERYFRCDLRAKPRLNLNPTEFKDSRRLPSGKAQRNAKKL